MNVARLHITFSHSAAVTLRLAFERTYLAEDIAPLADAYNMGPIDPGDADQRAAWEIEEFGDSEPVATRPSVASFWERVSTWPGRLFVWMSSQSVIELCGLHELLWRLPDADIHLVDIANVDFSIGNPPPYDERLEFACVRNERIVELALIDEAAPLAAVARETLRTRWQRLRHENAPLRVLTNEGLASAPIDYFDEQIGARVTDVWQSCARVVGDAMGALWINNDRFVFSRLLRLIETDEFEGETDDGLWEMRGSRIRRR